MFVTNIQKKANIFNKFFPEQCTQLKKSSVLPVNQMFLTQSKFNSIDFNKDEVLKTIRALNRHKAHGNDDISIRMIEICDKSLLKPLINLFGDSKLNRLVSLILGKDLIQFLRIRRLTSN